MNLIDRKEYIKEYKELGENVITKENLPFASDILEFVLNDKTDKRLQNIFDFFGDEEEIRNLTSRKSTSFNEEASKKFIASVIAANITDISDSGLLYKQLQASGDNYRIRGVDCGSKGREIKFPLNEEEFTYNVKNCNVIVGEKEYKMFDTYEEFCKFAKGKDSIRVRTPMTCKSHKKRGCCPICAGDLPKDTQNIGAFSTLMITETATQAALSSMNKGRKANINKLLAESGKDVKTLKDYYEWAENLLQELQGDKVERRWYEMALLGRLHCNGDEVKVVSLTAPTSKNYFGDFLFRSNERNYRRMISAGTFYDDSLKAQIAMNSYKKGIF